MEIMQSLDFKIIAASFGLIFLAELGDKTQLAAMALATSCSSAWMVFAGTSLGLIAAAALAVFLGSAIARYIPQHLLHIISAIAFILIGVALLVSIACKAPPAVLHEKEENPRPELISKSKQSE